AARDNGITGSIGKRVKSVFARGPLSKEDRESIEDESRVRER
ncbi:MAG: extensin, partial [Afipia sp.]|nr:extensin [Afipia sp.]